MSGTGTDIYFIGIIPALLLAVMLTLIMLADRDPRHRRPGQNPERGPAHDSQPDRARSTAPPRDPPGAAGITLPAPPEHTPPAGHVSNPRHAANSG